MGRYDIVIVGAGHGGAQAAIALRQHGFAGSIALVGDEPDLPYERPPLSKDYLAGDKPFGRMLIRPASFWEERKVEMLLGRQVVGVDPAAHGLTLGDGRALGYGKLIWAAGGTPHRLRCEGAHFAGVHMVRTRMDVDRIIADLPATRRVIVVGGGYIGLEATAVLTGLGKRVVLLEALDRVLARVAGAPLSLFYEAAHRAHGVDLRTGVTVEAILGTGGRVAGVRLAGGAVLAAEMVVVGIGVAPATAPLREAGAAGDNGVDVDQWCRTSLPDVYAVGDCAAHRNRFAGGRRIRLESVQNAHDQATTAARHILGQAEPYDLIPWFWSNQYDLKLQTVGLFGGHDDLVVRGDPAGGSFAIVYLEAGRVIALDCVNSVRDYVQGRKLILGRVVVDRARLADPAVPLKEWLA